MEKKTGNIIFKMISSSGYEKHNISEYATLAKWVLKWVYQYLCQHKVFIYHITDVFTHLVDVFSAIQKKENLIIKKRFLMRCFKQLNFVCRKTKAYDCMSETISSIRAFYSKENYGNYRCDFVKHIKKGNTTSKSIQSKSITTIRWGLRLFLFEEFAEQFDQLTATHACSFEV